MNKRDWHCWCEAKLQFDKGLAEARLTKMNKDVANMQY